MKKNTQYIVGIILGTVPASAFAALEGVKGLLNAFRGILDSLIPVIFGLALIFFFWGTAQFILNAGNEKLREDGKKRMLWGFIAIFVFVSIYGILKFVGDTIGISPSASLDEVFNQTR